MDLIQNIKKIFTMENNDVLGVELQNPIGVNLHQVPILKEQSINIERKVLPQVKQLNNSLNLLQENILHQCHVSSNIDDFDLIKNQRDNSQNSSTIEINLTTYDDTERDDLLLSTSTIKTQHIVINQIQTICPIHDKLQDIICMVQKIKICCYCALFGSHKDHTFKSQSQFLLQVNQASNKLMELQNHYQVIQNQCLAQKDLKNIMDYCQSKKQEAVSELYQQYNSLIQRLKKGKSQLEVKIKEQYNQASKRIKIKWQYCLNELQKSQLYYEWQNCGRQIINNIKQKVQTCDFVQHFKTYDQFPWQKGQMIIDQYNQKLNIFKKKSKDEIQDIKFNYSYSLKNLLSSQCQFDSQKTISLQIETPTTSMQELHKQLNSYSRNDFGIIGNSYQCSDNKQRLKFRHSQFIESNLKPIQEQIKKSERTKRASHKGLMNKSKNESIYQANCNVSTILNRNKSFSRLQGSLLSPKSRPSICRSPPTYKQSRNPLKILTQFQKNMAQNCLNFSNCGLNSQQLLYFMEKAFNSHIPTEINLQKNKITISGLAKLMPYLSKASNVNLSKSELDQGCLQVLSKLKGIRRLNEVNLSQNEISIYKSQNKIQQLKKMGLKIIM